MSEPAAKITAILQHYTRDAAPAAPPAATLAELGIDLLDLPMIFLDIEDAFGVQLHHDSDIDSLTTVEGLIADVAARIAARASQPRPKRTRPKGNWMSTGTERRR